MNARSSFEVVRFDSFSLVVYIYRKKTRQDILCGVITVRLFHQLLQTLKPANHIVFIGGVSKVIPSKSQMCSVQFLFSKTSYWSQWNLYDNDSLYEFDREWSESPYFHTVASMWSSVRRESKNLWVSNFENFLPWLLEKWI